MLLQACVSAGMGDAVTEQTCKWCICLLLVAELVQLATSFSKRLLCSRLIVSDERDNVIVVLSLLQGFQFSVSSVCKCTNNKLVFFKQILMSVYIFFVHGYVTLVNC